MRFPVELQDPRGLWLLGAVLPLVALYILKVRRTRVPVGSTWLWAAARRDVLARSPWQKLIAQVPLLLQLLALVMLALALARPATRHRAILGDHVAVILDTSASMSALDARGQPRIELAKTAAWEALAALSPGADAMLLEASREPRLVAPLDRDIKRLQAALDPLPARDVEGDLGAAVALASERLRPLGGEARILVFTDGNLAHPEGLSVSSVPLEVFTVGTPVDNAGIVRVDVRSGTDPASHQDEVQAFALVASTSSRPRDVFVTLRLAGVTEPLASRRLSIAPGEKMPVVLTFHPTAGDRLKGLVIEMAPHDAFAADDVAYARVPPGQRQPVALVSAQGSPWFERALLSDPQVDLWKGTPADLAAAPVAAGGLFVFDGLCPAAVPPGDAVIVNPPEGDCLGLGVGAAVKAPAVTSWASGDSRLRFLTLDGVHLAQARSLRVAGATQALIRSQNDVLAADLSTPGRATTVLGFDVGESDWPLKASFVLFVRNTLELARAHRAQGPGAALAGEPLRIPVPAEATTVQLLAPGAREPVDLTARAGLAVVSETAKAGLYLVSWQGPHAGQTLVPVSLASERESDLRTKPLEVTRQGASVAPAAQLADAHTDWAFLVAIVALLLVVLDTLWLTRRPAVPSAGGPAS